MELKISLFPPPQVDDIKASVAHLATQGIKPLDVPKIGSHGKLVVFLHPKDCLGTLVELEESKYPDTH